MKAYQFVIIRYVHNLSTEEFVNIGILLWEPRERRVFYLLSERYSRLSNFFEGFNSNGYRSMLRQLKSNMRAVQRNERLLREARSVQDLAETVVSKGPSCFQWSEQMGGVAEDLSIRVRAIFANIVDRHYEKRERSRRTEHEIYRDMHKRLVQTLRKLDLLKKLESDIVIQGQHFGHKFRIGWQNGTQQFLEPISFDYSQGMDLVEKAYVWSGRLQDLSKQTKFKMTGVVAPPANEQLKKYYDEALKILEESPSIRTIVEEDKFESFLPEIKQDLLAEHV